MDMSLETIFQGVAVIEPRALTVWEHLMKSFPPDHFTAIIKNIAEALNENQDETYNRMIMMVSEGISAHKKLLDEATESCAARNRAYLEDLNKLR